MHRAILAFGAIVVFGSLASAQQVMSPEQRKELEKRASAEKFNGKTLFEWENDLKSTDPSIKMKAVAAIKYYGTAAQDGAVPLLLKALTDKDASTRVNACISLGMIGFNARDRDNGISQIKTLLNDREGIVRFQAAVALSSFGPDANFTVPALATLTRDNITWEIRGAACTALATAGMKTGTGLDGGAWLALLERIQDPAFEVRKAALQGLLYVGKPAQPADLVRENSALVAHFNDRNEVIAIWARLCHMRINGVTDEHVNAIAKHLKSHKAEARSEACRAFAIIGEEAKKKVPDIMNHLDDKDAVTAIWACAAVAQMKDAGKPAISKLKKVAASNADDGVKQAAIQAISRLGGDATLTATLQTKPTPDQKDLDNRRSAEIATGKTLAEWMTDLRSTDPSIKLKAIANIKVYGAAARQANQILLRSLSDRDASTRVNACITLGEIGFDDKELAEGIARIAPLLGDSQGIVRFQAAKTLGNFGASASPAVTRLATLSKDPMTWQIREAACIALATAGLVDGKGMDSRAWFALVERLHDPCFEVKYAALKGLLYLKKPASAADTTKESTELKTLFSDKSEIIAMWARLCYMLLNGVSEEHLAAITKHMRSPTGDVRMESCKAMAIIGVEAKSQVNELVVCLDDKESDVALWACAALAQMKEAGKPTIPKLQKISKEHANPAVRRAAEEAVKRLGDDDKAK